MNRIDAVRRFNRFYTRRIGALHQGYMGSAFPLPQARVLYEIGQRGSSTASELGAELDLDLGYLSRLLAGLRRQGMVQGEAAKEDARRVQLTLTPKGRKAYQLLDTRSRDLVAGMLGKLGAPDQARLVGALQAVEWVLGKGPRSKSRSRCARTAPATWDGWCTPTAGSISRSAAGTSASRPWSRASRKTSSKNSIRPASAAGSPRWTASRSAACSR